MAILLFMADCSTEESLLVIRGFGIQTSTSSSTYLSTASTRFIPTTQIQDIVIHEAFKGFEVRFYLAVIVEGELDALVVFPVCNILSVILSDLILRLAHVAQARDLRAGLERFSTVSLRCEVMTYPQSLASRNFCSCKSLPCSSPRLDALSIIYSEIHSDAACAPSILASLRCFVRSPLAF